MFSLLRGLFVLLRCLGKIGLYRRLFDLLGLSRATQRKKVNISVSVHTNRREADVEKVEEATAKKAA